MLLLAPRVPYPPDRGDKIRSYRWLRALAADHDVFCACFADDAADLRPADILRQWCREVAVIPLSRGGMIARAAKTALTRTPMSIAAYDVERMHATLRDWTRRTTFDAALAYTAAMAPFAFALGCRRALDLCDCDSRKWLAYADRSRAAAWLFRAEGRRLAAFERACLSRFDAVWVVNEKERAALCDDGTRDSPSVVIVPNGVDVAADAPLARTPVLGFVGALSYRPNVEGLSWFVSQVWPAIRARRSDARFDIVGRRPARAVRRLDRIAGVRVIPDVADVAPWIQGMRLCVVPLHVARGVQNKVLEALAYGRPVVTTPVVADGLAPALRGSLAVAESPERFAEEVCDLLSDAQRCERLGEQSRREVARHASWTAATALMRDSLLGQST